LSTFVNSWRNIQWLVHYLQGGNAADIHFEDNNSLLCTPYSADEHWQNGTGLLRALLSTIWGP
jgi:hypothetical protein